jgi:hypothetical protein
MPSRPARLPALVIGSLVALATVGCVSGGAMEEGHYRHAVFGYSVSYLNAKDKALLGPGWQLDNFRYSKQVNRLVEKDGVEYMATRIQDADGDGNISVSEQKSEPIYDLKLVSKLSGGVIWTKAHPLPRDQAERALDVMLEGYADSLAGAGLYAQGNLFSVERPAVRNFTTFVVAKTRGKIGSHDALVGTIEIAEVDKLKLDPTHRSSIVKLAILKLRYFEEVRTAASSSYPIVVHGGRSCHAKVGLLVIGYHESPQYFGAGEKEFLDLLARVSFPDAEPLAAVFADTTAPAAAPPPPAPVTP